MGSEGTATGRLVDGCEHAERRTRRIEQFWALLGTPRLYGVWPWSSDTGALEFVEPSPDLGISPSMEVSGGRIEGLAVDERRGPAGGRRCPRGCLHQRARQSCPWVGGLGAWSSSPEIGAFTIRFPEWVVDGGKARGEPTPTFNCGLYTVFKIISHFLLWLARRGLSTLGRARRTCWFIDLLWAVGSSAETRSLARSWSWSRQRRRHRQLLLLPFYLTWILQVSAWGGFISNDAIVEDLGVCRLRLLSIFSMSGNSSQLILCFKCSP